MQVDGVKDEAEGPPATLRCTLKPTHFVAIGSTRNPRALSLNPNISFYALRLVATRIRNWSPELINSFSTCANWKIVHKNFETDRIATS